MGVKNQLKLKAGISIEYMYVFLGRKEGKALMVLKADDEVAAERVLTEQGIALAATSEK